MPSLMKVSCISSETGEGITTLDFRDDQVPIKDDYVTLKKPIHDSEADTRWRVMYREWVPMPDGTLVPQIAIARPRAYAEIYPQ
jgi:hypothetical protein